MYGFLEDGIFANLFYGQYHLPFPEREPEISSLPPISRLASGGFTVRFILVGSASLATRKWLNAVKGGMAPLRYQRGETRFIIPRLSTHSGAEIIAEVDLSTAPVLGGVEQLAGDFLKKLVSARQRCCRRAQMGSAEFSPRPLVEGGHQVHAINNVEDFDAAWAAMKWLEVDGGGVPANLALQKIAPPGDYPLTRLIGERFVALSTTLARAKREMVTVADVDGGIVYFRGWDQEPIRAFLEGGEVNAESGAQWPYPSWKGRWAYFWIP